MVNEHVTLDSPPGTRLENGAVLVVMLPERSIGVGRMVLAYTEPDAAEPWVTWRQGVGGQMGSGEYFSDFREAVANLYERAGI